MGFRQRFLDRIDQTGGSDWMNSQLATGSIYAVRNDRRGSSPRLDTLEARCRALGVRLETVLLDTVAKLPVWCRRLREEICRDVVETLKHGKSR